MLLKAVLDSIKYRNLNLVALHGEVIVDFFLVVLELDQVLVSIDLQAEEGTVFEIEIRGLECADCIFNEVSDDIGLIRFALNLIVLFVFSILDNCIDDIILLGNFLANKESSNLGQVLEVVRSKSQKGDVFSG